MGIFQKRCFCRWLYPPTLFFLMAIGWRAPVLAAGMGPFHLPALGPAEMFRETPMFIAPNDHAEGRLQTTISVRWLNVWTFNIEADAEEPYDWEKDPETYPFQHGSFLVDFESISVIPRVSFKLTDRMCLEAKIPVITHSGGNLDRIIEGFHDAFGINQHRRDKWERDSTSLLYVSPDGEIIDQSDNVSGIFLGNVVVGGSYRLRDAGPGVGVRFLAKLPTSNIKVNGWEQEGIDLSFQTTFSWNAGRVSGYHGLGIIYYGSDGTRELALKKERFSMMNSLEYAWSDDFSLLAHLETVSAAADYPELDNPVVELTVGFKQRLGIGILEFGIIENLFFFDNSPDIGVHAAYTFSLF